MLPISRELLAKSHSLWDGIPLDKLRIGWSPAPCETCRQQVNKYTFIYCLNYIQELATVNAGFTRLALHVLPGSYFPIACSKHRKIAFTPAPTNFVLLPQMRSGNISGEWWRF